MSRSKSWLTKRFADILISMEEEPLPEKCEGSLQEVRIVFQQFKHLPECFTFLANGTKTNVVHRDFNVTTNPDRLSLRSRDLPLSATQHNLVARERQTLCTLLAAFDEHRMSGEFDGSSVLVEIVDKRGYRVIQFCGVNQPELEQCVIRLMATTSKTTPDGLFD